MAKNKINIDNKLKQDLKKYASAVCTSLAGQFRDEMYKEAHFVIEDFYNDYEPIYYNRHYNNFRKNSFKKHYKNPHNSIIRGGIELTPNELDDLYRADKEYVFNLVYLGYHGNVNMFPHTISNVPSIMEPSPLDILLNKRDSLIENINDYKDESINKAKKQKYTFLNVF